MFDPVVERARKIHLKKREEEKEEQEEEEERGKRGVGMSWRKKAAIYYWHKRYGRRKI